MWKKILLYLVLILLTLYLFFTYDEGILAGLLIIEILYPIAALIQVRLSANRLEVTLSQVIAIASKSQEIPLEINIENKTWMPNILYRIHVKVWNELTEQTTHQYLDGYAKAKSSNELAYFLKFEYCGNVIVCVDRILVFDYLGIVSKSRQINQRKKIGILPECKLIPLEITRRTREFIADADEYSLEENGDDAGEIYQVRKYRERDSLRDIHWKLTAKTGELMVKEYSRPLGCVILIWIDLLDCGKNKAESTDQMLETAASIAMTLSGEKCVHMVAWYDEKNARVVKKKISHKDHVYELVHKLLLVESYKDKETAQVYYKDAFRGDNFSSIVVIDMKNKVTVNGESKEFLTV